jgi:dihydroorotate dehydrogenase electron transfer subunit
VPPPLETADREQRTLAPLGRRPARVLANEVVGAYRVIAVADRDGPADPRPGQFYMLATGERWGGGDGERPYLPRAFSFARVRDGSDGGPALEFLLEAIGPGTDRLRALRRGEEMLLTGPLGVGFRAPSIGPAGAVLVGGGIGVAPILCWSDELGPDAPVLLGFRSAAHAEAARLFPCRTELCTDDGTAGRHALVTELLREQLDARTGGGEGQPTVYACGPPPMLEAVRAICAERDTPGQLALESGMACGFGACFGCVVATRSGYVRLCVDGPVLDAAELETAAGSGSH